MALCGFCNKWMEKGTGKRPKKFCNDTCRSNFWYAKNKKGKPKEPESKIEFVTPTPAAYDGEKIENIATDEPTKWVIPEKLSTSQIEALMLKYVEEKIECSNREEYQNWLKRLNSDSRLNNDQRSKIKNAQ